MKTNCNHILNGTGYIPGGVNGGGYRFAFFALEKGEKGEWNAPNRYNGGRGYWEYPEAKDLREVRAPGKGSVVCPFCGAEY